MSGSAETAAFLAAVEAMLRDKVLPGTTGEARFSCLMAASAVGMARRGVEHQAPLASAAQDVMELAPEPSPFDDPLQAVVLLLREGLIDGQDDTHRRLMIDAVMRTAVTRPNVLTDQDRQLAGLDTATA